MGAMRWARPARSQRARSRAPLDYRSTNAMREMAGRTCVSNSRARCVSTISCSRLRRRSASYMKRVRDRRSRTPIELARMRELVVLNHELTLSAVAARIRGRRGRGRVAELDDRRVEPEAEGDAVAEAPGDLRSVHENVRALTDLLCDRLERRAGAE